MHCQLQSLQAYSDFARQDSESILVEDYVHGNEHILLSPLKCWLPMNHTNLTELLTIAFEVIIP